MANRQRALNHKESFKAPFLPDICSLQAVFLLVLLGELLALGLTLAGSGLSRFDWEQLGLRSFLLQWIVLLSAALLCPLRPWLAGLHKRLAGGLSFLLILMVTAVCSGVGLLLMSVDVRQIPLIMLSNLLLAAIFGGVALRYLYVQQQWSNQQKAELQARLQALQARIHPHFLFNSMNSIASLIATSPNTAERLVEDLCSLFRVSLAEPGLVALADEMDLCRQYLDIEAARLGDRLQVDWQLAPALEARSRDLAIPGLLLQPLLENAIQHGIQSCARGGTIAISLQLESRFGGERVIIEVGNPVEPQAGSATRGNSMALENIEHRLQAYFGDEAEFRSELRDNHFVARIVYPVSARRK